MIRITDSALWAVHAALGAHPPEQGGALFGPPGGDLITAFIHDAGAKTTGSIYHNTHWLIEAIAQHETSTVERFKGIIHSHPRGVPHPSGQDRTEYASTLANNPEMVRYLAPIVTHDVTTPLAEHELVYSGARYSFFSAHRSGETQALLIPEPVSVLPIHAAWQALGRTATSDIFLTIVGDEPMFGGQLTVPGIGGAMALLPMNFPTGAPILVRDKDNSSLAVTWNLNLDGGTRLVDAVRELADRAADVLPAAADIHLSRGRRIATPEPKASDRFTEESLFARSSGLVSQTLRSKHVLVVGLGSVGSYVAEMLSRAGVGRLTLVDPEVVEPHNIGRSLFSVSDIGQPKVDVVAHRIETAIGVTRVTSLQGTLVDLDEHHLAELFNDADLVLGLTDNNRAQLEIAQFAYWHRRRGIFSGLYEGAGGGEVVVSDPNGWCWDCILAGARSQATEQTVVRAATDYGTGRLVAQPGLLADIHHVSTMAIKLALGALEDDPGAEVFDLYQRVVNEGRTFMVTSMKADSTLVEQVFGPIPGQLAYQTVWATLLETRPDCTICGRAENRSNPYAQRGAPNLASIRAQRAANTDEPPTGPPVTHKVPHDGRTLTLLSPHSTHASPGQPVLAESSLWQRLTRWCRDVFAQPRDGVDR